jgi:hypothetical protein
MAAAARFACAALVALAIAVTAPASAHAGSFGGVPPPDVQQVFDDRALPFIRENAPQQGGSPNVFQEADGIQDITEVNGFTFDYANGKSTDTPYEPIDEWLAAITADFVVIGTIRVWIPEGGDAEIVGFDGDGELGGKLAEAAGVDYIEDPRIGASYAAFGDTIGPLDDRAAAELPEPMSLDDFQKILFARIWQGGATADPGPGVAILIGVLVLTLAVGIAVMLSARGRARRSATG